MTVKELANKRPELTDIEIEDNGGKDLSAYDLKTDKKYRQKLSEKLHDRHKYNTVATV